MQPIKTTNAMNPAPAKGIESFPTPVIDDVVISEIVNSWKGDYQPLEYGVLWKDVSHAPNQGSFPEHKLVFQQPTSEDGQWVKRIWVNDRVNQDSYNYAIKYSAGSQEHPIYIRTYIVPRETYAPLLDGTPDPLFPGALLVDEEAVRNEGELDSKYITVTRVYETLPGPAVPTRRYNERGDLETVIVQTVPPNTIPTADGLLVTQSQVEQVETGKGVKTTATVQDHALLEIKEKKEGLLGETITTDDIVSPSTNPDPLSQTIVASTVEQYTATKARKRTTTSSGPTSLTQKSQDGKLLGNITSTESVVAPSASPDAVSFAILSSEVKQVDSGKAIKRNVVLNGTPPTLSGKQNEQGLLGVKSTTESIVAAGASADALSLDVISSVVEPIDSVRSRKVTISSDGPLSLNNDSLVDSPLGLVNANIEKSIVSAGTKPSTDEIKNLKIVKDSISPIDKAKSEREKVEVSSWPTNTGVDYDEQLGIGVFYTETIVAPNSYKDKTWSGVPNQNIKPLDNWKSIKKEIDKEKVSSALLSQWYKIGIDTQVSLPDKLLDIIVYWGRSYANGGDYDFGAGVFTGSYNRNQSGSSKSSYSMNGDVYFNIQKGFNGTIPGYEHIFFIEIGKDGLVSQGDVIARLNFLESSKGSNIVYKNWPYLQLRSENLVLISGGISLTRSRSLSESASINGFSQSTGKGQSFDVNVNANSVNIPESLHGRVTIKNEFIGSEPPGGTLDVTYGVNPSQLSPTEAKLGGVLIEVAQFPTGNYLLNSNIELYKWGFVKVTAKTVTISSDYI